jgi:hypothetical protein
MRAFPTIPARPSNICYCGGRYAHAHAAPPAPDARLRGLENVLAAALQYIEADRAWRRVDYTLNCDPETKASFRCTQDDFARSRERYWKAKDALWEASLRAHEGEK